MAAMGGLRVVDLNRPKALNALNINMIRELYPFLVDWNRMGGDVNVRRHALSARCTRSSTPTYMARPSGDKGDDTLTVGAGVRLAAACGIAWCGREGILCRW
eukprot:COSAG02_NODE_10327_length_1967_cov_1.731799_3_plen_102_part_00